MSQSITPTHHLPLLVGIDVLADRSGYQPASIRNLCYLRRGIGALAIRVGGRLRWRVDDVERWLAGELDEQPAPEPTPVAAKRRKGARR